MTAAYKIFLSSPSDVEDERLAVQRVVDQINASRTEDQPGFELFRWEEQFYTADSSFQDQVVQPAECDLVLCVLWKRLGSELPPNYQRPDGTTPTGTEYEFEQALAKATEAEPKTPDIFVYLKTAPVVFAEETMAIEVEQRQKLLAFWSRWFRSEQGHFTAAYQKFEEIEEFEDLIERNLRTWLEAREPGDDWRGGSPFPGLRAYDVEDGDIFFGRSRDVGRTRARLFANAASGAATLIISGASGAGKSSVLRAGLIASLIRPGGFAPHADIVHHLITTPAALAADKGWATSLAAALLAHEAFGDALRQGDFDQPASLGGVLALGGEAAMAPLRKALERLKAAAPDGAEVAFILAIDQFEEAFQFAPEDAEAFGALLTAMADAGGEGARFVILGSMRSDHRHRWGDVASLALLSGRDQVRGPNAPERFFDLAPPRPADLREIIAEPARIAGLTYEADAAGALATVIEAEATGEALPALQLLLFSLYEDRQEDLLRFETYRSLGGVGGVMATTAEKAFLDAPAAAQGAFPRVLRALVAESIEGGGAVARWAEAEAFAGEEAAEGLITALTDAHLLRSEDRKLRVAHESLLTNWSRAADQIAADKRFFDIRARLGARAARWKAAEAGQAPRMLLRDFDLEEGRALISEWGEAEVAEAAPDAPVFIRASSSAARRRRLTTMIGAAAALVVLTTGAFVAWTFRTEAEAAAKAAEAAARQAAIQLEIGRATEALRVGETDLALASALKALDLAETAETRSILAMAVNETSPHLVTKLDAKASALSWGPDGSLSGIYGGAVWRAEAGNWAAPASSAEESDTPVLALAVTADGWAGVRSDGAVVGPDGVRQTNNAGIDLWSPGQVALQADDAAIKAVMADGIDGVWALSCKTVIETPCAATRLSIEDADAIAFKANSKQLIAAHRLNNHASIARYALPSVSEVEDRTLAPWADGVAAVAASPADGSIVIGGSGGDLFLAGDGDSEAEKLAKYSAPVLAVAWSPDGARFVANCDGGDLCLFSADGRHRHRLIGGKRAILWVGFSPDGAHLASLDDQYAVRIWSVAQDRAAASVFEGSRVEDQRLTALAAYEDLMAGGYSKGDILLWRRPDATPEAMARDGDGWNRGFRALALSPTGQLAAIDGDGDINIWRRLGDGAKPDTLRPYLQAKRVAFLSNGDLAATTSSGGVIINDSDEVTDFGQDGPFTEGVAALPDGGLIVSTTDSDFLMFDVDGAPSGELSPEIVNANLSSTSLSVHPGGRWLAASRDDGIIRLYTLDQPTRTLDLPILARDSKFVAFSADGGKLAALDAGGALYVWTFDADQGAASPYLQLPALPAAGAPEGDAREATGLGWLGPDCLAIASQRRGVFQVCHDVAALKARAERLLGR